MKTYADLMQEVVIANLRLVESRAFAKRAVVVLKNARSAVFAWDSLPTEADKVTASDSPESDAVYDKLHAVAKEAFDLIAEAEQIGLKP